MCRCMNLILWKWWWQMMRKMMKMMISFWFFLYQNWKHQYISLIPEINIVLYLFKYFCFFHTSVLNRFVFLKSVCYELPELYSIKIFYYYFPFLHLFFIFYMNFSNMFVISFCTFFSITIIIIIISYDLYSF